MNEETETVFTPLLYISTREKTEKRRREKAKNRNQRQEIRGFWAEKGMKGGGKYTYRIQKHTLLKEKKRFIQEEMAHFSTAKKRKEEKKKTKPDEERRKTEEKNFRKGRRKRLQGFRKSLK